MLRYFFGMLVDENTVLLDPTCGSGSSLRAAESLGARSILGLERNPEFADLARDALKRARTLKHTEKAS
jgi:DNA modification methylase